MRFEDDVVRTLRKSGVILSEVVELSVVNKSFAIDGLLLTDNIVSSSEFIR